MIFIPVKAPVPIHQALIANRIRITWRAIITTPEHPAKAAGTIATQAVKEVTATAATISEPATAVQVIPAKKTRRKNPAVSLKKQLSAFAWDCSSDCLQESASMECSI